MSLRTIPDFTPSADAYAASVASMDATVSHMAKHGVRDRADIDLYVAIVGGMVDAQLANDPGGDRWSQLLERAVNMFADNVGITDERSRP